MRRAPRAACARGRYNILAGLFDQIVLEDGHLELE
jgi:hypothetical protein